VIKRKCVAPLPRATPRSLAPAQSSRGLALRAVLVAAAASASGCDVRTWPDEASAAVHRAGVWIGVIDEPRAVAGQMEAVHVPIAPSASASK
jgi:hypothetical protein